LIAGYRGRLQPARHSDSSRKCGVVGDASARVLSRAGYQSAIIRGRIEVVRGSSRVGRTTMRKFVLIAATVIGAAALSASPISIDLSANGLSVSQDKANAVIGRPATPGSVAGVHRRHARRAVRRCAAGVTCPHY
jgi:hypothetical protein